MGDPLKFYTEKLTPFWKRHSEVKYQCVQDAEKLFFDLLKLMISLSAGMMAFIAAVSRGIEIRYLIKFIILLVISIISAILAFANSAREYQKEANQEGILLHRVAKTYSNGDINGADKIIKDIESKPLEEGYNEWHNLTIFLGIISIIFFLIGTVWFIVTLLNISKPNLLYNFRFC